MEPAALSLLQRLALGVRQGSELASCLVTPAREQRAHLRLINRTTPAYDQRIISITQGRKPLASWEAVDCCERACPAGCWAGSGTTCIPCTIS